ncbi:lytic polysaccharide monooxygenase auxiliary activity family 9 protein [Streptomyces anandii]|uniref:Lytic polysaccharide monooxygenase n=1 Tax=Streptomyces anandii TaxID=285454 RepID=A0ABW6HBD9_9ACTN
MTRITAPLKVTGAAVAASALLTVWAAGPAHAHGAPTDPVSRVFACSPDGGARAGTPACRAAVAANGAPFTAWDNLRVPGVDGRDRRMIPDGKLCSGGLPAYKGLDLARADWPVTRLTAGARMTMTYASTIAHEGTFKLYLTKPGYDPSKPLTWSEIPDRPFAQVTDPALTGGAYHIAAKLPADRTGHHVLFTIWQNSSTPDTYYSCSDVVLTKAASTTAPSSRGHAPASPAQASKASPRGSADASPRGPVPASTAPDSSPVAAATDSGSGPSAPMVAGGAAAVLVLTGGAALALRLRRR